MSHLDRNLGFRLEDSDTCLFDGPTLFTQFTLLSAPVEHFPAQQEPSYRDLLGKHLADVDPLDMERDHGQIWNILELLEARVVFRLLHAQPRGLQQRPSFHGFLHSCLRVSKSARDT